MKFIIDTQLPPRLANFIVDKDLFAIHTSNYIEDGQFMSDQEIIEAAISDDLIIISKDKDFEQHYLIKGSPPRVIHLTVGNISNKELLKIVDHHWKDIELLLEENVDFLQIGSSRIRYHR